MTLHAWTLCLTVGILLAGCNANEMPRPNAEDAADRQNMRLDHEEEEQMPQEITEDQAKRIALEALDLTGEIDDEDIDVWKRHEYYMVIVFTAPVPGGHTTVFVAFDGTVLEIEPGI